MNTETPQMKLATKNSALQKAKKKLEGYLKEQDLLGEKIASAQEAVTKGEMELETIQELCGEYEILQKQDAETLKKIREIQDLYDHFEWTPNMPNHQKIEYSEYPDLVRKRRTLEARMTEIPKEINKIYYRR